MWQLCTFCIDLRLRHFSENPQTQKSKSYLNSDFVYMGIGSTIVAVVVIIVIIAILIALVQFLAPIIIGVIILIILVGGGWWIYRTIKR